MKTIYLAGGCFWGVEAYFQRVLGVKDTTVGYANGISEQASYQNLKNTKHAEAVKVVYDETIINLAEILERFLLIINPFSLNKQGNDIGEQYRTGIYYEDEYSYLCALKTMELFHERHGKKSFVEIEKLRHFIDAEDYHQDYLFKNPNGYCHLNLSEFNKPLSSARNLTEKEIEALDLDELSYNIMINKKTERPFTSMYNEYDEVGIYIDKISKQALFSSEDKYDAGCGWPSFTRPITTDALSYFDDFSHNMYRVEVLSKIQNAHLGHVFEDGPRELGGKRYCINGMALKFIPLSDMKQQGYGNYLPYFKKYVLEK